jgi:hypothetical protein
MKLKTITTLLIILALQALSIVANPVSTNEVLPAFELESTLTPNRLQRRRCRGGCRRRRRRRDRRRKRRSRAKARRRRAKARRQRRRKRIGRALKKAAKKVGSGVKMVAKSTIASVKQLASDCTGSGNIKNCLKAVAKQAGSMAGNMLVPGLGTAISMSVTAGMMAKKHL